MTRIAACGGVYANPYALQAFVADARARGAERLFCLGDLGGYGAEPDAVWPILEDAGVECIAGNYELAVGWGEPECGCGYRDPLDNHYAQLLYDYTVAHTSPELAEWMTTLPTERLEAMGGVEVHFVHGSTIGVNDFWWESLTEGEHARRVAASGADVILCTHSGLPWQKRVDGALVVNVGVLGRPANDGRREVWYALVDLDGGAATAQLMPLAYDWQAQAASMRAAGLPEVFVETVETGWWTTCLEVLPPPERARGRYQLYRSALPEGSGAEEPNQGERPVVPLFGTPLFPSRLWLVPGSVSGGPGLDPGAVRLLLEEAETEGFAEVGVVGDPDEVGDTLAWAGARFGAAQSPACSGTDLPVPELTVSAVGVHWHPEAAGRLHDPELLLAAHPPMGRLPLATAKRMAIQRCLERRAATEVSSACAVPSPATRGELQ